MLLRVLVENVTAFPQKQNFFLPRNNVTVNRTRKEKVDKIWEKLGGCLNEGGKNEEKMENKTIDRYHI